MKEKSSTPQSRWAKRSLKQQLLYKFINDYGYEHGPLVAGDELRRPCLFCRDL